MPGCSSINGQGMCSSGLVGQSSKKFFCPKTLKGVCVCVCLKFLFWGEGSCKGRLGYFVFH